MTYLSVVAPAGVYIASISQRRNRVVLVFREKMSSKVILLKYVARFCDATKVGQYLQLGLHCDKTAVILKRTKNHSISIQGYPEVPISEKHKAWLLFQVSLWHSYLV